jgi:CPA2 family monovalent cation:H+ antiporter-2
LDLAAAPRRALLVTIQLTILLVGGGPLVAVLQPFYPSVPGAAVLLVLVAALAYPLWRSAGNLQGHARAGAQVILEALASQSSEGASAAEEHARSLVPGLGEASVVRLQAHWPAVGRSLKQIALRGRTGAFVIAVQRQEGEVIYPDADDVLRTGDALVLTGTADSVRAARRVLQGSLA